MNRFLQLFSILLLFVLPAQAQQVIYNYTTATNGAYNSLAPNLTATNLVTVGSWGSNTVCAAGGGISGLTTAPAYATYNPANAASPALNVNITPAPGYYIQINSISVSMRRSGQGPAKARLAYSLDGGTTWIDNGADYAPNNAGCGNFTNNTWNLTTPAYLCSGMLKVRVYYYGSAASTGTCQTANLRITGDVGQPTPPAVSINAAPAGPVCAGTNVTFTATPVNGGSAPVYTWFLNGGPVGSNTNTYSNNSLSSTDIVTCSMVSNAPCITASPVSSNALGIAILQPVTVIKNDTICNGGSYLLGTQTLTASGAYTATFTGANGCDSTVNLNLFVRPAITYSFADTICNNGTYAWGGQSYTASGTYNHSFSAQSGCDSSVTLHLFVRPAISNNVSDTACNGATYTWAGQSYTATGLYNHTFTAANGCDSSVTLHLFIRPAITYSFADTICSGPTYTWGGQTYNASGNYNHTFTAANGCDSSVTLHLFVKPVITYSFADTICSGPTYTWAGQGYTTTGNYNKAFTTAAGCDSTVTLHLFVKPAIIHSFADSVCSGSTYTWAGQTYTATGNYNKSFTTTAAGCDSTVTLHLFVKPAITHNFADSVCSGGTYTWAGQTYTATGNYNKAFTTAAGCDSTVTLHLFVKPAIIHSFADSVCSGGTYTWAGQTYTATGNYNKSFTTAAGCDSTVTLHLFVKPAITHSFADSVCSGGTYTWAGQGYTTTGNYNKNFTTAAGCDSIVTLHLFVKPVITHSFADSVCSGGTYTWAGQGYTTTGNYNKNFTTAAGCDSIVTLNLFVKPVITHSFADTLCNGGTYTWAGQTYTTTGNYNKAFTTTAGCDSTVTLHLFVRPAITHQFADTACAGVTYAWGGQSFTATGVYNHIFTAASGCDSTVTLHLFVRPVQQNAITRQTCFGVGYVFGNQTLFNSGIYTHVFQDVHHCDSTVTLTLNVGAAIIDTFPASICAGTSYNWAGQSLTLAGTYNHTFTAGNGCDSLVTLLLTVKPVHTASISVARCYGESYSFGNQTLTLAGTYTHVFQNTGGCDSTVTLHLQISAQPAQLSLDTAACGSVWFEGTEYTTPATLLDTFLTAGGCDSLYRVVHIKPHALPVLLQVDTAGCSAVVFETRTYTQNTTLRDTLSALSGCDSVVRIINIRVHQPEQGHVTHEMCTGEEFLFNGQVYTAAGTYPLYYRSRYGCDSVVSLEIVVHPHPVLSIAQDQPGNHCIGDSVLLVASGAQNYTWTYNEVETNSDGSFTAVLYRGDNAVSVTGTDENGCSNSAAISIEAQACCAIWMPNAFSPNGDGLNDIFKPESQGHPSEYVLQIYNRWGATVFTSYNISKGWDGTINNGQPADIADYHYRITGKCANGEPINMRGNCTLVR
ncbi:gliding motility-associated C-terminal domain-containing protein [Taibaiella chishuiensis]|uniref:Gliding motility-associated-like protein n=1 Tax=Taibaiella chishuiensis TaxID=1434707 RepID=A0A2P8DD61_9BACT|nr:gliding motility-associated C-terminal domain-containing protein [Taibaiella chishuiensis]PSK95156.1 gliding motility-associated-like protein [Taibaiella chishuiensis]